MNVAMAETVADRWWKRFTGPHGGAFALGILVGGALMGYVLSSFVYEPRLAERDATIAGTVGNLKEQMKMLRGEIEDLKAELEPYRAEGRRRLLRERAAAAETG